MILGSKSILWNKYSALGLLLLLFQLLLSASSNFVLVNLGVSVVKGITSPVFYITNLSLYISLLILAEIPGFLSKLNFDKAVYEAQKSYITQFTQVHKNQVVFNAELTFKQNQEAWLVVRSGSIIQTSLSILYNVASLGLGVFLNISVISIVGDIRLIISYVISSIVIYITIRYFKNDLSVLIKESSDSKVLLAVILQSGWDNIVIGNKYNYNNWWRTCMERLKNASLSSFTELYRQNCTEFIIRFLITLPIFVGISAVILININIPSNLAPLLVTLPVQMRSIPEMCAIATYISFWNKMSLEMDLLTKSLNAPKDKLVELENQLVNRVQWNIISFTFNDTKIVFSSVSQIIDYILLMKNGRLCIRGANQSGKTTIANILKQQISDAVYIPTNSKLYFKSTFETPLSTGQKILNQLEELFGLISFKSECKIIILDEWDANLDDTVLSKLSELIDDIAKRHKVIEIRHRHDIVKVKV